MDSGERPPNDDAGDASVRSDDGDDETSGAATDDSSTATNEGSVGGVSDGTEPRPRDAHQPSGTSPGTPDSEEKRPPAPEPGTTAAAKSETTPSRGGVLRRVVTDQEGPLMWIREVVSSALVVLAIGLILFALSGVWPPMVAIESGSMEPNMVKGDLVFVTDPGRFAPDAAANDVGVVTHEEGRTADYRTFGTYGSVVVFAEPGRIGSPIIHRAMFHVEEGENWVDRADDRYLRSESCDAIRHCPAPHDGYITKGDNNAEYDQVSGIAAPVQAEWITGVARVRIPYLGWIRLMATGEVTFGELTRSVSPGQSGPSGVVAIAAVTSAAAVARETRRSR